jgi:uncharacterized protein
MSGWSSSWSDPEGLEVLDREECRDLLASVPLGRVAFCREGTPTVLPVNHVVDAWTVAFRTSFGSKLDAALGWHELAFEADAHDPRTRTGWSVLVVGRGEHVTDPAIVRRLDGLGLDVWADAIQRSRWVRISMDDVSGRRIDPARRSR